MINSIGNKNEIAYIDKDSIKMNMDQFLFDIFGYSKNHSMFWKKKYGINE